MRPKHLKASVTQHGGDGEAKRGSSTTADTYVPIWKTHLSLSLYDRRSPGEQVSMMNGHLSTLLSLH